MNKYISIDFAIWIIGSLLLIVLNQAMGFGRGWLFGSFIALTIAVVSAAPSSTEINNMPTVGWLRMKNDTSSESPFIVMPSAEPYTAFDGYSTYITQEGYEAMLKNLGKAEEVKNAA